MPRQSRASRTRSRTQRPPASARPASVATPVVEAEANSPAAAPTAEPLPDAPAPRRTTARAATAAARQPRGIVTDYNYVISELKQIFILTVVILVILVALYFVIG